MTDVEATFLFADIAGFTALTEAHGDEDAARLAGRFCEQVRAVVPDYGAEHVKNIGDALMLRIPEPAAAVRLGLWITHELMAEHGSPSVRVGLHHGPAVRSEDDYYGAAVNLAARISGEASANDVLMSAATAERAGAVPGVMYEDRGRRRLRHVHEPVELVAAVRAGEPAGPELALDPVCRMAVDPAHAVGKLVHRDQTHWFCSLECAAAFAASPDSYLR